VVKKIEARRSRLEDRADRPDGRGLGWARRGGGGPLEAGADASLKDNDGQTARKLAEDSQHPIAAELFKARPAPSPRTGKAAPRAATKPTAKASPKP
jgi:hypothetical protein